MPRMKDGRRKYGRRRPATKPRTRRPKPKVPRSLKPRVINFKRDIEQNLVLSNSSPPEGWASTGNRIYNTLGWALSSLGDNTDFINLFRNYRLKGARVRMYFSNTASTVEQDSQYSNSQILVRMAPNPRGEADTMNDSYWQSINAKKYKTALNGGKPLDVYMPLKQRNEVKSSTGTVTTMVRPEFISTGNANVVHYGLNMSLERVDGAQFTSGFNNNQHCKMITTLYFQCQGIE